ncbi:FkbM family methyltransferase [Haloarcula amylolytica]|uniref:FkbM family methyltransferase n=1 Tax=Haloarcula amylolytica TaxID=396317 RepID=UPI003C7373D9
MKRKAYQALSKLGQSVSDSRLAKVPLIEQGYRSAKKRLDPEYIQYEGYTLHIPSYETVAQRISEDGAHEKSVRDAISQNLSPGDTAIDLGAHYGSHTLSMANYVGPGGYVIAFEPYPQAGKYLQRTIDTNSLRQVELVNRAVGNDNSSEAMVANDSSTFRSIDNFSENGTEKIEIDKIKLSAFMDNKEIETVDLMKVDIEGGEGELFEDIHDVIEKFNAIVLEYHNNIVNEESGQFIFRNLEQHGSIETVSGRPIQTLNQFLNCDEHMIWKLG